MYGSSASQECGNTWRGLLLLFFGLTEKQVIALICIDTSNSIPNRGHVRILLEKGLIEKRGREYWPCSGVMEAFCNFCESKPPTQRGFKTDKYFNLLTGRS